MKHKFILSLPVLVVGLLMTSAALAQSGGTYDLSWNTWSANGGTTFSTGGTYAVGGTAAQPDAGKMTGGTYALAGGFWQQAFSPTADYLVSSGAQAEADRVEIQWVTGSERETQGYNVWRRSAEQGGVYARLNNDLIPATYPGADLIVEHTYTDTPKAGSYFYKVEIVLFSGPAEWSEEMSVQAGPLCTNPVTLLAPANQAKIKRPRAVLKWQASPCAGAYRLVVREDSTKGKLVVKERTLTATRFKTMPLRLGIRYVWQVRACGAGKCQKSEWQSFSLKR